MAFVFLPDVFRTIDLHPPTLTLLALVKNNGLLVFFHRHMVFEEISRRAKIYGTTVTGSELVGLIPLKVMDDAGRFCISKNNLRIESEKNIIQQAIDHLGLNELSPFYHNERILEFLLTY